jgi:hypothetical protein
MQIAVSELRRAARTANALEKLRALEVAEQKLNDSVWLRPEASTDQFQAGLQELRRSRMSTLREQAVPAVERLLEAVEKGLGEREMMLAPAGELLALLYHYLPDEPEVQTLSARFRQLGGKQAPYQPITPLSEMYHRPAHGIGCATLMGGLIILAVLYHLRSLLPHG